MKRKSSNLYIFFANSVVNIPPVLNSGIELANHSISNIIIGYKTETTKTTEFLNYGSRIFRLELRSRKIKVSFLRKIFSIVEFIIVSKHIAKRSSCQHLILFNEVASMLGRFLKGKRQIHWSLEFPENETKTRAEGILKRMAFKAWRHADVMVFPSNYRKAMGMVLNPEVLQKRTLTVHNTPLLSRKAVELSNDCSDRALEALTFINEQHTLGKKIIVYAGAVGNRYGWDSLIEAVGNVEGKYALLILGTKHELGNVEFETAIRSCVYPENILWLDAIPYFEMQAVLHKVDIGFVHYRGDTLNTYFSAPGKLYEYLKAGLAILTDENACIAEDLASSDSSLIFALPLTKSLLQNLLTKTPVSDIARKKKNAAMLFEQKYHFEKQLKPLVEMLKTEK